MRSSGKYSHLDWLKKVSAYTEIKAHGKAVGLPEDSDMGNSEVGHNAIGCGRVFAQGASLIDDAISSREIFKGKVWNKLLDNVLEKKTTLHFYRLAIGWKGSFKY